MRQYICFQIRELEEILGGSEGDSQIVWTSSRNANKDAFQLDDIQNHRGYVCLILLYIVIVYIWLESYLSGHIQYTFVNNTKSNETYVTIGFLQDSVLGPILCLIYVNDIGNTCTSSSKT